MDKILICLATAAEANACRKGIVRSGKQAQFEILQTGMGLQSAAKKLRQRLRAGDKPRAIISSGFAGSLDLRIGIGSWAWGEKLEVSGTALATGTDTAMGTSRPVIPLATPKTAVLNIPLTWHSAIYRSTSEVVAHGRTEIAPPSSLAQAVDMESEAWFQIANEKKIPFFIVRLISDSVEKPIPVAIKSYSNALLNKSLTTRLSFFSQGTRELVSNPFSVVQFIGHSMSLLGDLAEGWTLISAAWLQD